MPAQPLPPPPPLRITWGQKSLAHACTGARCIACASGTGSCPSCGHWCLSPTQMGGSSQQAALQCGTCGGSQPVNHHQQAALHRGTCRGSLLVNHHQQAALQRRTCGGPLPAGCTAGQHMQGVPAGRQHCWQAGTRPWRPISTQQNLHHLVRAHLTIKRLHLARRSCCQLSDTGDVHFLQTVSHDCLLTAGASLRISVHNTTCTASITHTHIQDTHTRTIIRPHAQLQGHMHSYTAKLTHIQPHSHTHTHTHIQHTAAQPHTFAHTSRSCAVRPCALFPLSSI